MSKIENFYLFAIIISACSACGDRSGNLQAHKSYKIVIDLTSALTDKEESKKKVIVNYDRFFKAPKNYIGYELRDVLDTVFSNHQLDTSRIVLEFQCKDGYKPTLYARQIFGDIEGFIACADAKTLAKQAWPDSISTLFSPYYLVWPNAEKNDYRFVWPYGLTKISLFDFDSLYGNLYPRIKDELNEGFELFRTNCMQCHSLKGIGGKVGPDFATPKNIIQYRSDTDIRMFVRNPKLFIPDSQMPDMTYLSDEQLKKIIAYLKILNNQP